MCAIRVRCVEVKALNEERPLEMLYNEQKRSGEGDHTVR